ncbi:MAG: exodeoxyribonuclease VII large subunit, partial [Pontibacterium sp.]
LRLQQSIKRHLERKQATLALSERRLSAQNTTDQVKRLKDRIEQSCSRMEQAMTKTIERKRLMAAGVAGKLNAVSPLATLDRGYAIVQNQAQQVITNAKDVSANEKINIRLHQGHIEACVVANDVNPEQSS